MRRRGGRGRGPPKGGPNGVRPMTLLVQKYGGTSVGGVERIRAVAERVSKAQASGHQVVVVVSAMAGETNRLLELAGALASQPAEREVDVLLATGEQESAALLAIALQQGGVKARSFLGHQIRIDTDSAFGRARIRSIDDDRLRASLGRGEIAVVAGFQGVDGDSNITTLGRGGSDTSAVAVAAALKADVCEIYSDVDGVYTSDPRIVAKARKLDRITYEEMLELASLGAKVLQTRSVELAMRYKVRLQVLSSFEDMPGTLVCDEEEIVEQNVVSGVAHVRDEAKVTLVKVPDRPGVAAAIFGPLADHGVNVDMIVQNIGADGMTDMTFSCPTDEVARARAALEGVHDTLRYAALVVDEEVAKVSVVGIGMRSHSGVAQKMFSALAGEGINIKVITTSEIKVSVLIDRKYMELAVQALHKAFGLDIA